ncbi:hypothetical protein [Amycolatopsis sp. FDAARGOS 1241]|uniref:hypothetical protein n=1 Tax=Amycolatopsis sp. FDAARGOS 1241 TaxID=2778070 RepID=UPI00194FB6F0|nr:hypothetical protein [Amycolatopsis sp. FDAARGOS 1241]QRP42770.1 hypothetical protein I6J71_25160 [Amycolatopsis sp. FDAARGOS 1241]
MAGQIRQGWRLGGVAFVACFVASLVASAALAKDSLYLPGASPGELREYYTGSRAAVLVSSAMQLGAALGLALFGAGLVARIGPAHRRRGRFGCGLAAASLAMSALLSVLMVILAADAGDDTLRVFGRLILVTGGALHLAGLALLIWSVSRAAAGAGLRPRPAWRAGLVIAPVLAVSLVSIVLLALTRLEPLWRLLAAVWISWVCAGGLAAATPPDQHRPQRDRA